MKYIKTYEDKKTDKKLFSKIYFSDDDDDDKIYVKMYINKNKNEAVNKILEDINTLKKSNAIYKVYDGGNHRRDGFYLLYKYTKPVMSLPVDYRLSYHFKTGLSEIDKLGREITEEELENFENINKFNL